MDDTLRTVASFDDVNDGVDLRLRLRVESGRVVALEIANGRPAALLDVLRGRRADDVPALVQRLFPICGYAHALACASAIAAARGEDSDRLGEQQRDLLWAELAVAHGWRCLIDWPALLGRPPQLAALRQLMAVAARLRALAQTAPLPGAGERAAALNDLAAGLGHAVFGDRAPGAMHAAALSTWVGAVASPLHDLLRVVQDSPLAGLRPPDVALLPMPAAAWFAARLSADPAFGRHPHADGLPAEVSAYARCTRAERERFDMAGPVAARLLAMLGAAAALIATLRGAGQGPLPAATANACSPSSGSGCAVADTVRGPLAYWVRLDEDRIADLHAVAPTEWALHPRGALHQWLPGLPAEAAQHSARLAVAAVDPCAVTGIALEGVANA